MNSNQSVKLIEGDIYCRQKFGGLIALNTNVLSILCTVYCTYNVTTISQSSIINPSTESSAAIIDSLIAEIYQTYSRMKATMSTLQGLSHEMDLAFDGTVPI